MAATALHHDLALANHGAPPRAVAAALAGADPLRLELPPLPGLRAAPEALRAMSGLYLAARLEEMGVLKAAEWLVRERATLRVPASTAAKLEDFARRQPEGYPPEQRTLLFGRLFGIGPAAAAEPSGAGSRFEPLLAALCSAIAERFRPLAAPRPEAVSQAALDLAAAAGSAFGGAAALAVARLGGQLRRAIEILSDPGVGTLVGARGFWAVLRRLLEPNVPDLRRLLDAGRHGQRVLAWLAEAVPALERPGASGVAVPPEVVTSAAAWLVACGITPPARREGLV
ncbi:MAG TPA: hypothetical protein VGV57_06320 [Thermoleophilaceae bacterium]|nr:hypothetical protein [Thermoleophilaceae bacterium]